MASDDLEYDFIVSLTSYPKRINVVHEVIESLLGQTFKVKKIVLWLAESQFPNREKDLPKNLLDLNEANFNFEIGWCEDLRSYKKLIPTLKKYPNTVIITVDDDLIYDKTMIEKLYKTHLKYPKDIICHRAHYILFNKKEIKPYKEWLFDCQCKKASFNLFQTGAGAVLYPIGCFYKDITNATLFKNLSFDTDDIWFWAMSVLNNTKIRFANKNISSLNYIAGTQNDGLCINNVDNGNNDKNIQKVLNHYPLLLKKLEKTDMLCNNVLEKVFSVKNNQQSCHKIFTILGIQLKFKSRKLFERKKFNYMENTLRLQEEKLNRQFEYLKNNLYKKLDDNNLLLKENYYANVLRDSIQNSYWLKNKSFTLTGGAANYSFIFTLYKLLDDLNPQNILEFGLGQTTKLTTQYVNNKNINCILDVIEHNNNWINVFKQQLSVQNKNINIYQKDLIRFKLNGIESDKYDDLKDIVQNKRYDLVIIDGPFGFDRKYPRTNILDLIPNNLADSFAIILDDAERDGEKNTAQLIFNKLEQYDINYKISYKKGIKTQLLITSLNYEFIHWI